MANRILYAGYDPGDPEAEGARARGSMHFTARLNIDQEGDPSPAVIDSPTGAFSSVPDGDRLVVLRSHAKVWLHFPFVPSPSASQLVRQVPATCPPILGNINAAVAGQCRICWQNGTGVSYRDYDPLDPFQAPIDPEIDYVFKYSEMYGGVGVKNGGTVSPTEGFPDAPQYEILEDGEPVADLALAGSFVYNDGATYTLRTRETPKAFSRRWGQLGSPAGVGLWADILANIGSGPNSYFWLSSAPKLRAYMLAKQVPGPDWIEGIEGIVEAHFEETQYRLMTWEGSDSANPWWPLGIDWDGEAVYYYSVNEAFKSVEFPFFSLGPDPEE